MVLCKFFQQGSCRFGAKCTNEHFDVKQLVKSDVESACHGKQWPFSCFGPFKDKPSLPDFIEDRSFEEMRFLCYESKKNNYFEQFHQQFTKEALEATNKMKTLLQLTPEVVDIVSKVYDTPDATTSTTNNSNNPFGLSATPTANSIFSKPGGGGFVGNSGAGIFGGGNPHTSLQQGSSIFAGGAAPTNVQQSSIFGQQQTQKPANSIFGGSSVFAQPQQQQPTAVNNGGGIFAQASQPMQPTQAQGGGGYGLFAQAAAQQPSATPGFVQQQPQQNMNPFGQPPTQQQSNAGIFAQAAQQTAGNIFAQATQSQNIFSQAKTPQQQQQVPTTNIFAQAAQQVHPSGGFFQQQGSQQPVQQQQQPFMQQQQTQSVAAALPLQPAASSTFFSKMEDLTAEDIEAFQADTFGAGKIPFSPPPRELIN